MLLSVDPCTHLLFPTGLDQLHEWECCFTSYTSLLGSSLGENHGRRSFHPCKCLKSVPKSTSNFEFQKPIHHFAKFNRHLTFGLYVNVYLLTRILCVIWIMSCRNAHTPSLPPPLVKKSWLSVFLIVLRFIVACFLLPHTSGTKSLALKMAGGSRIQ